ALGGELEVPAIDGKAQLKSPPGTRAGTVFRLEGKGFPHVEGWGRGDELVRVDVDISRKLNKRERELLQELARLRGEKLYGFVSLGFFGSVSATAEPGRVPLDRYR